jgi:hypothetical protein
LKSWFVVQDLCLWKDCKKFPTVWRLCMVVLIGAFSIYMCMIGVDHSKLSYEDVQQNIQQQEWKQSCPGNFSTSLNFIQHYPRPLTYDRCSSLTLHRSASILVVVQPESEQDLQLFSELFSWLFWSMFLRWISFNPSVRRLYQAHRLCRHRLLEVHNFLDSAT